MTLNPPARFVQNGDYAEYLIHPVCDCGHLIGDHIGAGCYSKTTINPDPRGYCRCMMSPAEVNLDAVEKLVRAKIAAELDRLAADLRTARVNVRPGPGAGWAAALIDQHAEEIRNG